MPLMTRNPNSQKTRAIPVAMAAIAAFAIACGTVQPALAAAVERTAVSEIKPLLMRAAEQGLAYGVLDGMGAAYVQRRFDTASPIEIDVRRLRALPQAGCSRLEVTTRQHAVLVAGQRQDQELVYQLSFCADGRFPQER
jgi:hypothetical protein